ncbi:MAG: hypothetical protein ACLUE8_13445 [Lachnospiraceae bacterium]
MPRKEKANYTIKNVGKGKWVRLAKLTAEQAETLKPQIAAVLSCGMDESLPPANGKPDP